MNMKYVRKINSTDILLTLALSNPLSALMCSKLVLCAGDRKWQNGQTLLICRFIGHRPLNEAEIVKLKGLYSWKNRLLMNRKVLLGV